MSIASRNLVGTSIRACALLLAGVTALGCGKQPACTESTLSGLRAQEVAPILEHKAKALLDAVQTGDSQKAEDPVIDLLTLPAKADEWFTRTFDPKLAPALSAEWNESVFKKLGDMIPAFKAANKSGQTEVRVTFVCKEVPDGATALQKAAFAAMTEPAVLYTVNLVRPGESTGITVGSFAVVASHLALVGKMTKAGGADPTPAPTAPPSPPTRPPRRRSPRRATRGARRPSTPASRRRRGRRLRGSRRSGADVARPSGARSFGHARSTPLRSARCRRRPPSPPRSRSSATSP